MLTQPQVEQMHQGPRAPHWNIGTRIAFRFSFVYLGLFVVYFSPVWLQYLLFIKRQSPLVLGGMWPMRQIVFWAGAHIFHMTRPPSTSPGFDGSYYWVEAFCTLVIAVLATAACQKSWRLMRPQRTDACATHVVRVKTNYRAIGGDVEGKSLAGRFGRPNIPFTLEEHAWFAS
jgi:hypothetical protein